MSDSIQVPVPDIGDFKDVEIIEILVKVGEDVRVEQPLATLESDKASIEIPSPQAGKVLDLLVKIGDKVSVGSPLLNLKLTRPSVASPVVTAPVVAPAPTPLSANAQQLSPPPRTQVQSQALPPLAPLPPSSPESTFDDSDLSAQARAGKISPGALPNASPSVRRFARELGVDLQKVSGSGSNQRILREDLLKYVQSFVINSANVTGSVSGLSLSPWPSVDFTKFGPVDYQVLPRIRKISAANLHRNWVMIPHVTSHDTADITELEAFRVQLNSEGKGPKLTLLPFLMKASVSVLKKFPEFNASLDGESLALKRYYHIGFAADTPSGLVVPVIRDVDKKGVFELAEETADLAAKAREGKLSPTQMQGGSFSISSLGGIGGTYFTPIINAPEVAILGVCRAATAAIWSEQAQSFQPRLILPLSLSWDHRVIDGAASARFNRFFAQLLEDFRRILL